MRTGNWVFQPKLLPSLATLAGVPLLLSLGFWQLHRADTKAGIADTFLERRAQGVVTINTSADRADTEQMIWRRGKVHGRYEQEQHYLLDNQVNKGRAGYFVYTPLRLEQENKWILVNRGWLPTGTYRDEAPVFTTPPVALALQGFLARPPSAAYLSDQGKVEAMSRGITRLQSIDIEHIKQISGLDVLPYVLRLNPAAGSGFIREWSGPGFGVDKHLGYAFQWFVLAALLVSIYIAFTLKRTVLQNG